MGAMLHGARAEISQAFLQWTDGRYSEPVQKRRSEEAGARGNGSREGNGKVAVASVAALDDWIPAPDGSSPSVPPYRLDHLVCPGLMLIPACAFARALGGQGRPTSEDEEMEPVVSGRGTHRFASKVVGRIGGDSGPATG